MVGHATVYPKGPQSPTDVEYIRAMFEKRKASWYVCSGETDILECKLNYAVSGAILKAIAGLANNKGGHILFGVKDGTSTIEGMSDNKFHTLDPAILNSHLLSTFDPVPTVKKVAPSIGGKRVGVMYVEKHPEGPVIAVKNVGSDVREGAIYFRYVGETRQIKPGELRQIIKVREQKAVEEFSRRCHAWPLGQRRPLTSIRAKLLVSREDLSSIRTYCLPSSSSEKATLAN
jgi:Putative DNA-binding domain